MIGVGAGLILKYQWILIVYRRILVLAALKVALINGNEDSSQSFAMRLCKKFLPTVDFYDSRSLLPSAVKPTSSKDAATGEETMDSLSLAP